jgi:hypothetical protein
MNSKTYRTLGMLVMTVAMAIAAMTTAVAQSNEGLRIGILGGANYNYVDVATQEFVRVPGNFASHDFSGASSFIGFGGVSGEYMFNNLIGATLRTTLDFRCVEKEDNGSTFTPHLVYVNIEPGVRLNLGMPQLHALVGGTIAIKAQAEYDYTTNDPESIGEIKGAKLDNVRDVAYGAWASLGYDIGLGETPCGIGLFATPFIEGSYLFDQKKPDMPMQDDKWWNTLTVRAGVQIKAQF